MTKQSSTESGHWTRTPVLRKLIWMCPLPLYNIFVKFLLTDLKVAVKSFMKCKIIWDFGTLNLHFF